MTDRRPCGQIASEDPREHQAYGDPQAPQVPRASQGYQDPQELTEYQGSRVSQETQVVKDSQDPQGSWGPEDPKVWRASVAQMDTQVPPVCRGLSGPQGTGAFPEKFWEPSLGPGEMLGSPDTLG